MRCCATGFSLRIRPRQLLEPIRRPISLSAAFWRPSRWSRVSFLERRTGREILAEHLNPDSFRTLNSIFLNFFEAKSLMAPRVPPLRSFEASARRLIERSMRAGANRYAGFAWSAPAPDRLAMSPALLPLAGLPVYQELNDERRWQLALLETVNFFSLTSTASAI